MAGGVATISSAGLPQPSLGCEHILARHQPQLEPSCGQFTNRHKRIRTDSSSPPPTKGSTFNLARRPATSQAPKPVQPLAQPPLDFGQDLCDSIKVKQRQPNESLSH
jgi:hypothetical protein